MTVEQVKTLLERARGITLDRQLVALVMSGLNQDALAQHTALRVRYEIWDQRTPLNGVAPADILSRRDYAGGTVYLVYIDNALAMIQLHAPGVQGFVVMDDDSARSYADTQVADLQEQLFRQAVLGSVDRRLIEAGIYPQQQMGMDTQPATAVVYTEGVTEPAGIAQAALDAKNG